MQFAIDRKVTFSPNISHNMYFLRWVGSPKHSIHLLLLQLLWQILQPTVTHQPKSFMPPLVASECDLPSPNIMSQSHTLINSLQPHHTVSQCQYLQVRVRLSLRGGINWTEIIEPKTNTYLLSHKCLSPGSASGPLGLNYAHLRGG